MRLREGFDFYWIINFRFEGAGRPFVLLAKKIKSDFFFLKSFKFSGKRISYLIKRNGVLVVLSFDALFLRALCHTLVLVSSKRVFFSGLIYVGLA